MEGDIGVRCGGMRFADACLKLMGEPASRIDMGRKGYNTNARWSMVKSRFKGFESVVHFRVWRYRKVELSNGV